MGITAVGYLALKIQYSCRLQQSNNNRREKGLKSKRKPNDRLLPKWEMLLSICIHSSIHLSLTQEDHKKHSGSHVSVCSFVSSQSFKNPLNQSVRGYFSNDVSNVSVRGSQELRHTR